MALRSKTQNFLLFLFFSGVHLIGVSLYAQSLIIPEPALQQAVANSLGVAERDLTEDLIAEKLIRLEANNREIRDLTGLDRAKNLQYLVLRNNLIEDLSPIQKLSKLRKLDLHGNRLRNLSTLSAPSGSARRKQIDESQKNFNDQLVKNEGQQSQNLNDITSSVELLKERGGALTELNLSNNRLLGLSGIEYFNYLRHLDVSNNSLIDLEGISKLSYLINLYAHGNQLGRIEEYVDRNRNKQYDLGEPFTDESGNGKRDIDPLIELQGLPNLVDLHLYDNRLKDINSVGELSTLQTLLLSGNELHEVEILNKFHTLKQLSLANNQLYTVEGLQSLGKLERLNLSENHICDLRPLRSLFSLHTLDLHSNIIIELNDLSRLSALRSLGLSYNLIHNPLPVLSLPVLSNISLSNNRIPTEKREISDALGLAKSKGVYFNTRNQFPRSMEAENLTRLLIGYPEANLELSNYLRTNGYRSLYNFLHDEKFNEDTISETLNLWDDSLKKKVRLENLSFPGN